MEIQLHNLNSGQVALAILGLAGVELEGNAACFGKSRSCCNDVAVEVVNPVENDFSEHHATVVVAVGMRLEDDDGILLSIRGDDVEVGNRKNLACDVLSGELLTADHKVGQSDFLDSGCSEVVSHSSYSFKIYLFGSPNQGLLNREDFFQEVLKFHAGGDLNDAV